MLARDARTEELMTRFEQNQQAMQQNQQAMQQMMQNQQAMMHLLLQQSPASPSLSASTPRASPDAAASAKADSVSSHASSASDRATDLEDGGRYEHDEEEDHESGRRDYGNGNGYGCRSRTIEYKTLSPAIATHLRTLGHLKDGEVEYYLSTFQLRAVSLYPSGDVRRMFTMSAEAVKADVTLKGADLWLLGALLDTLDMSQIDVKNFRALNKKFFDPTCAEAGSGMELLERLQRVGKEPRGAACLTNEQDFIAFQPFTLGMKSNVVMHNALATIKLFEKTAAYNEKNTYGVLKALIDKMPAALSERKEHHLRKILYAHSASGNSFSGGNPHYTVKSLIEYIAIDLVLTGTPSASAAAMPKRATPFLCFNCGSEGHKASECPNKCAECGLRCCPGAGHGQTCAVKAKMAPTAALLAPNGGPITAKGLVLITEQWNKMNGVPNPPRPPNLFGPRGRAAVDPFTARPFTARAAWAAMARVSTDAVDADEKELGLEDHHEPEAGSAETDETYECEPHGHRDWFANTA